MATTIQRDPEFFLDGRKRTERVWTQAEAAGVPIIFATGDTGKESTAFGFSSKEGFETWLGKNGLAREYEKAKLLLSRAPRTLSRQQEAEASAQQAKRLGEYATDLRWRTGNPACPHPSTRTFFPLYVSWCHAVCSEDEEG